MYRKTNYNLVMDEFGSSTPGLQSLAVRRKVQNVLMHVKKEQDVYFEP